MQTPGARESLRRFSFPLPLMIRLARYEPYEHLCEGPSSVRQFEYVALGMVGLIGLFLPSSKLLTLCGWVNRFFAGSSTGFMYGLWMAGNVFWATARSLGMQFGCRRVQHVRAMLVGLCIVSLVGGLLGIWGVSTQNQKLGHAIWLILSMVSAAVALWNLKGFFVDRLNNPLMVGPSIFWASPYVTAYVRSFRSSR
jgi:hypothetical protein